MCEGSNEQTMMNLLLDLDKLKLPNETKNQIPKENVKIVLCPNLKFC